MHIHHRINARLDEQSAQQLGELTAGTGRSVSQVLREAIAAYHVQLVPQRKPASRFLALAGAGRSGRSDVASNVKAHLSEILEHKHGLPALAPSRRQRK